MTSQTNEANSTAPQSTCTGQASHGDQEGPDGLSNDSRDRGEMTGPAPSATLGGRAVSLARPASSPGRHVRPEPLGRAWVALTAVIGAMAALIGLGGMVLSFRSVRDEMLPAFGAHWAPLVPLVVDLTVFVFSGVDLVLARLDMGHPLARWTVYGATGGTVWLNYSAGGTAAGRVAHVLMPSIWVVFIELMRHVVRHQVNLATNSHREPVPAARWLLSPWPTLKLWRRMVLWRINSYPRALDAERIRLTRVAEQRQQHGRFWRWRVDPLTRLSIDLAEPDTLPSGQPTGTVRPDTTAPIGQHPDTRTIPLQDARPDSASAPDPDTSAALAGQNARHPNGQSPIRTPPELRRRPDTGPDTAPDTDRVEATKRRASDEELTDACQLYAIQNEIAAEHLTRAQIKEAAAQAGYTVGNDRVTRISDLLDRASSK